MLEKPTNTIVEGKKGEEEEGSTGAIEVRPIACGPSVNFLSSIGVDIVSFGLVRSSSWGGGWRNGKNARHRRLENLARSGAMAESPCGMVSGLLDHEARKSKAEARWTLVGH